jgi:hypothetical protein
MLSRNFWLLVLERAVKSAAQAAVLAWGSSAAGATTLDWSTPAVLATAAVAGFGLSVLTSIASASWGEPESPSLVAVNPDE